MLNKFYQEEKNNKIDRIITIIAITSLPIIPLIVYKYETISFSPVVMNNFYSSGAKVDVFNFS